MLKATRSTRVYRLPTDEDNEGWPLTDGRDRLQAPLTVDGDAEPDVFDLRERLPEEFATSESPQQSGRRAKALEERLADTYPFLERVEDTDTDGESEESEEGDGED
jgi:hypothetical protein